MEQVCQVLLRRRLTHIFVAKFVVPVHRQVRHKFVILGAHQSTRRRKARRAEPAIVRNIVSSVRGEAR